MTISSQLARAVNNDIIQFLINSREHKKLKTQSILEFEKILQKKHIQCVVLSKEKVVYVFGENVEKYENKTFSKFFQDIISEPSDSTGMLVNINIIEDEQIRGWYHYNCLYCNDEKVGILIFLNNTFNKQKKIQMMKFVIDLTHYEYEEIVKNKKSNK